MKCVVCGKQSSGGLKMSRRERTGYYDRTGKAIKDGDRIKAIIDGQIYKGYVEEICDIWHLVPSMWDVVHPYEKPYLFSLESVGKVQK